MHKGVGLDSREESEDSDHEARVKIELPSDHATSSDMKQDETEQHYFNFRPTSPTRKRIPIYATDLMHTNSYRALSQTALSVAELAEEAARRSLESSRIFEDGSGRRYVRGSSSSRPGSTRSVSRGSTNTILSPDLKSKGKRTSKSKKEFREWDSIHPHTELSPTRENSFVKLEGSKSKRRERKTIPLNHNLIDSFTSHSSSDSKDSKKSIGNYWEDRKRNGIGRNTSNELTGIILSSRDAGKGKERAREDGIGNLQHSTDSLASLNSNNSTSNSSSTSSSKSQKEIEEEIRGRDMSRTSENTNLLNRLHNENHSQSPCPSDLTTVPNHNQIQPQVVLERPTICSRSQSRNQSKRFLSNLSSKKKSQSPSTARRGGGTGMVLLAMWSLFSFGFSNDQRQTPSILSSMSGDEGWNLDRSSDGRGRVLSFEDANSIELPKDGDYASRFNSTTLRSDFNFSLLDLRHPSILYFPSMATFDYDSSNSNRMNLSEQDHDDKNDGDDDDDDDDDDDLPGREPHLPSGPPTVASWERIIGRSEFGFGHELVNPHVLHTRQSEADTFSLDSALISAVSNSLGVDLHCTLHD